MAFNFDRCFVLMTAVVAASLCALQPMSVEASDGFNYLEYCRFVQLKDSLASDCAIVSEPIMSIEGHQRCICSFVAKSVGWRVLAHADVDNIYNAIQSVYGESPVINTPRFIPYLMEHKPLTEDDMSVFYNTVVRQMTDKWSTKRSRYPKIYAKETSEADRLEWSKKMLNETCSKLEQYDMGTTLISYENLIKGSLNEMVPDEILTDHLRKLLTTYAYCRQAAKLQFNYKS